MASLISVVEFYGAPAKGYIPAEVGQITNFGTITHVSGELLVMGPTGSFYCLHTQILKTYAEGSFGHPTGVNCISVGHSGAVPNRGLSSGSAFANGSNSIFSFGR